MLSFPTESVAALVSRHPELALLVLHGSRARGDEHPASDWDFAYLADGPLDPLALAADLRDALGSDDVDLADLGRASGLLRYRVARDGVLLYQATPGRFDDERVRWVGFWLDVAPTVREAHDAVLAGLVR